MKQDKELLKKLLGSYYPEQQDEQLPIPMRGEFNNELQEKSRPKQTMRVRPFEPKVSEVDLASTVESKPTESQMTPELKDYLKSKYGLDKYSNESRESLLKQNQEDSKGLNWNAALASLGAGLSGRDALGAGMDVIRQQDKQRQSKVDEFDKSRSQAMERFEYDQKLDKASKDEALFKRENDLTSKETALAQELARKMLPNKDFTTMTAAQINKALPSLTKIYELEQKKLDRAETRAMLQQTRATNNEKLKDQALEKDVQKLSEKSTNAQSALQALNEVNNKLGFNIDDLEVKDGAIKHNGKNIDLPGVSLPLIGRTKFFSSDARELHGAIAKVFNTELKDRSGAAVTNPELERLKEEFGSGKLNSEAEMIDALKRYKAGVLVELKNREAGFKPEVVERYKDRGGVTSEQFGKESKQKTIVSKQYSPSRNLTKVKYSDGSEEMIPGK